MRRSTTLASLTLAVTLLGACAGGSGASQTAETSGGGGAGEDVLKVAGTGVSYPSSYMENGELVGFETDVIREAAERAGYQVEFSTMDFPGLLGAVNAGRIDTTATSMSWTPERAESYVFSSVYAFDGVGISTRADNTEIESLDDLDGKTVATGAGTTNEAALEAWIEETGHDVEVRSFETADAALQEVLVGRADAQARPEGGSIAQIENQGLELKTVGELISYEQFRFPFADTERGRQLAEDITTSLNEMREDGTMAELSDKYYTFDRSEPVGEGHRSPEPGEMTTPEDAA